MKDPERKKVRNKQRNIQCDNHDPENEEAEENGGRNLHKKSKEQSGKAFSERKKGKVEVQTGREGSVSWRLG